MAWVDDSGVGRLCSWLYPISTSYVCDVLTACTIILVETPRHRTRELSDFHHGILSTSVIKIHIVQAFRDGLVSSRRSLIPERQVG
jgi:hypothetical protein